MTNINVATNFNIDENNEHTNANVISVFMECFTVVALFNTSDDRSDQEVQNYNLLSKLIFGGLCLLEFSSYHKKYLMSFKSLLPNAIT